MAAMKPIALACVLISVLLTLSPLRADEGRDLLFKALREAPDAEQADLIAAEIRRLWREDGGPTVEILFEHADLLMAEGEDFLARAKLTGITEVHPEYAEGWAQRGAFLLRLGELDAALADLETAVGLEPRHFAAHALIGEIRETEGDWGAALDAYRAAHDLNPMALRPAERVRVLEQLMEGGER